MDPFQPFYNITYQPVSNEWLLMIALEHSDKYVHILTPGTSESALTWKQVLQVRLLRSLLIQTDWRHYSKEEFRHRNIHKGTTSCKNGNRNHGISGKPPPVVPASHMPVQEPVSPFLIQRPVYDLGQQMRMVQVLRSLQPCRRHCCS